MIIWRRLIGLRESEDLSIAELSRLFNVNWKTIWRAETEQFTPKTELLILYAKHFNVSMDYLTGLIDTPRKLY